MFFSTYVLTKKGPLAKVWLAAHWDRKLTKNEVKVMNLRETIIHIIRPVVPIAIRTSGELLIGVVRIYALKVKHLLREATEASIQLLIAGIASKKVMLPSEKLGAPSSGTPLHQANVKAVTYAWGGNTENAVERDTTREGQFADIADILGGASFTGGNIHSESFEEDLLRAAWYAVEPILQNDTSNTQQDFDDIARMRADLMAFGERGGSGSNSTTKSKSSLSSIEKVRGSHAMEDVLPFPTEDLDVGVPLPEELPMAFVDYTENSRETENPFDIPGLLPGMEAEVEGAAAPTRRHRQVHFLDAQDTTLPREVFEKYMSDTSDIVDRYEARHGPVSEAEEKSRYFLSGVRHPLDHSIQRVTPSSPVDVAKVLPFSPLLVSPSLRHAFVSGVQSSVSAFTPTAMDAGDEFQGPDEALLTTADDHSDAAAARHPHAGTKRERQEEGLSGNAAETLQRIQNTLEERRQKARRTETSCSCTFDDIARDLPRREVARAFVDVLSLVSKQLIRAHQSVELGELVLELC